MREATAIAHSNLALSKYWGKRSYAGNFPAVPSLSVTLSGLSTRTSVVFHDGLREDLVVIGGAEALAAPRARVVDLLDRVRRASGEHRRAEVTSHNDFPTASGLASSASGFAALALAAVRAAGLDWDAAKVSDLARRSSASAARSLFGGFVELDAGPLEGGVDDFLAARPLAAPDHLPLCVLVCVTTEAQKHVGSTQGMKATMELSPYARAWLEEAPRLHLRLLDALVARDFGTVGVLAEASAFAMHASAIAAGILYWNSGTVAAIGRVRALREEGMAAFVSIDAGPHVKVLTTRGDAPRARRALEGVAGVERILEAQPGPAARIDGTSPASLPGQDPREAKR
jgi:diphosphomevalonate decarboxylase